MESSAKTDALITQNVEEETTEIPSTNEPEPIMVPRAQRRLGQRKLDKMLHGNKALMKNVHKPEQVRDLMDTRRKYPGTPAINLLEKQNDLKKRRAKNKRAKATRKGNRG